MLLSATSSPVLLPLAPQSGSHITTYTTSESGHNFKRLKGTSQGSSSPRGCAERAQLWNPQSAARGRREHRPNKPQITADGNFHSAAHRRLGKFLSDPVGIQHVPCSRRSITYVSWHHPCQFGPGILQPFN